MVRVCVCVQNKCGKVSVNLSCGLYMTHHNYYAHNVYVCASRSMVVAY